MIGQAGEWNGVADLVSVDARLELLAERLVQRPVNEIVGFNHTDLLRRLLKERMLRSAHVQISEHRCRPARDLLVERLWRPAAPKNGSTADTVRQAWKLLIRMPGESPHFVARHLVLSDGPEIHDARRARRIETEHRIVLHVLRQGKRTTFEDENAMRMRFVSREEALRENRSEAATADDDQIERSCIDPLRACERFVETVADESAEDI